MRDLRSHLIERVQNEKNIVIPYLMAGDGGFDKTAQLLDIFEKSGVSAIEIGIPFSDPVADGPVIQAAGLRALEGGVSLRSTLDFLIKRPAGNAPLVLMTYLNPIMRIGFEPFLELCKEAHVAGLIIPDLPLEEMEPYSGRCRDAGLALVPLIAPRTSDSRLHEIAKHTDGYLYAVTVSGITGSRTQLPTELPLRLKHLKSISQLPVIAGFGIASIEQMKQLKDSCDGFIIGSHLVEMAHQNQLSEIQSFLEDAVSL